MTVSEEMYLENLEEYVNDENRIVTYKWLSKTLAVHVNQAKQMLYSFVERERNEKENDQISALYFVSGFQHENGIKVHKMRVVPEELLEACKKSFNPLTSCHIYSVQKCKVKDADVLYSADLDITKEQILHSNRYSAIKCTCAKLRSEEEVAKLKTVAQPTTNAPSFTKAATNDQQASKNAPPKKSAGIAGMFAATSKKQEETETKSGENCKSKNGENTSSKNVVEKGKAKGKAGIANFFSNQASKPKQTTKVEDKSSQPDEIKKGIEVDKTKPPSPKQKAKSKSKRKEDSQDDDSVQQKKRRRIKAAVWSDSSDSEVEIQEMEEEPLPERVPSPEKQPDSTEHREPSPEKAMEVDENISAPSGDIKRRKRHKKMVSKTFMDDKGYMVTEKVWEDVSESASEGEDMIPPTPPPNKPTKPAEKKKKTPTKKVSPGKTGVGKQTSLMSFFKKK